MSSIDNEVATGRYYALLNDVNIMRLILHDVAETVITNTALSVTSVGLL